MSEVNPTTTVSRELQGDKSDATGFHTAMVHLYRGEMNRMTVWRERLDVTSNWAILLTVGLTTFTLGSIEVPHYILLLGLALIGIHWQTTMAEDLRCPRLRISWLEAIRARLRRNYLMLLYFVTGVWVTKLFIHPASPASPAEFYLRLAVGDFIPPWFVAVTAPLFIGGATILALTYPSLEKLEDWSKLHC